MRAGPEGARLRRLGRVAWNLRPLGLLLAGPLLGLGLVAGLFGLAPGLGWLAGGVLLLSLSLFGVLARGEWRRLAAEEGG